jgi:hypothetical protein
MRASFRFRLGSVCAVVALALTAGTSSRAHAWDPSTTHQSILEAAVKVSRWHVAWMDQSDLQRGVFSRLRIDPEALTPDVRSWFELTQRAVHEDSGARARGGPGACPGADAPPETNRHCVREDLWELDALGWVRFGVLLEGSPRHRIATHFLDASDPASTEWADANVSRATTRRRLAATGGQSTSGAMSGSEFSGRGPSTVARLDDTTDPLSLAALSRHLRFASLARDADRREHHLALALVVAGAIGHVTADLTLPEHARGDLRAFFAPLSYEAGDRGSVLQEWARMRFANKLPEPEPRTRVSGDDPHSILFGARGAGALARQHFFSPGSLPDPRPLEDTLSPEEAATLLLGDEHGLHPDEVENARLNAWPAEAGYLLSGTGRPLFAFRVDASGLVTPEIDETVRRDQATQLLPAAVTATAALLDAWFAGWPQTRTLATGTAIQLSLDSRHGEPILHVLREAPDGTRTLVQSTELRPNDTNRIHGVRASDEQGRTVLALEWTLPDGSRVTAERVHAAG